MHRLLPEEKRKLVLLRKQGKSIPEISRETGVAKTTVLRHIRGVDVPEEFRALLREKQGGSKDRAKAMRENMALKADAFLGKISDRDFLFLLIGLYWGEGTKGDFAVINSDPVLIQTFMYCLEILGITKERVSLTIRVHRETSIPQAKKFWAGVTGISEKLITQVEVIEGKKKGKLVNGMCRLRVRSGVRDRVFIQSAITSIGKECGKRILST